MARLLFIIALLLPFYSVAVESKKIESEDALVQALDKNKDGSISEAEFMAYQKKQFKQMDFNGDGKVTAADLNARKKAMKEKLAKYKEDLQKNQEKSAKAQADMKKAKEEAVTPKQADEKSKPGKVKAIPATKMPSEKEIKESQHKYDKYKTENKDDAKK